MAGSKRYAASGFGGFLDVHFGPYSHVVSHHLREQLIHVRERVYISVVYVHLAFGFVVVEGVRVHRICNGQGVGIFVYVYVVVSGVVKLVQVVDIVHHRLVVGLIRHDVFYIEKRVSDSRSSRVHRPMRH